MTFSKLFLLNFCILQWSGFRLAKVMDSDSNIQTGWTWVRMRPLSGWIIRR